MDKDSKAVCFSIPYPETKRGMLEWNRRYSLNAYWSGKHPRRRAEDARHIHDLVSLSLKKHHVKRNKFVVPVEVKFYWNDRLDIDNHGALGKMIVDALCGYLLEDDNPKWFRRVTHEFWDGSEIGVEVRAI